jgi:predicted PurR-regulated permease PerM
MPPSEGIAPPEEIAPLAASASSYHRPPEQASRPAPRSRGPRSVIAFSCAFALGAGLAYLGFVVFNQIRTLVYLLMFSLLIGVTLDSPIKFLMNRGLRRPVAGILVWLIAVALLAVPVVLSVDAATSQLPGLIKSAPTLISNAESHLGSLGSRLKSATSSSTTSSTFNVTSVLDYVLRGGEFLFNALTDFVVVAFLSLYFAIKLPTMRVLALRTVPASRRTRVAGMVDDLINQVGKFMLSTILIAVIFGTGTALWCVSLGIPYPVLLGALAAVLGLIPFVGSTAGGAVVTLISLTVSLPTAVATLIFYIAYRLAEDYIIQPRMMRFSVELPGVITVPSVILGGAILGIPGALFAIPLALIVRSLVRQVVFVGMDRR